MERGYDRLYGARPMGRVIQESIKKPLAEELLFGRLTKGGAVKIGLRNGELVFDIVESSVAVPSGGEDERGSEREEEATS